MKTFNSPLQLKLGSLIFFLIFSANASAASCTWSSVVLSPSPTTIYAKPTSGYVSYYGSLIATFNCTVEVQVPIQFTANIGSSAQPLYGTTGITIIAVGSPSVNVTSGTCFAYSSFSSPTYGFIALASGTAQNCLGTVSQNFQIVSTGSAITGSLSATTPSTSSGAWIDMNGNAPPYGYLASSVPIISSIDTCTVSSAATSVALPNVSTQALAYVANTAMRTPFTLVFSNCSVAGGANGAGFIGTETWSYTPAGSSSYIANTASAPALNVYIQLLDSTGSSIANGGTTAFTVPQSGGSISQTFYAQYISGGTPVAGNVRGLATYTMSYN